MSSNLYECLQRPRDPGFVRPLWIDALCINQHDLAERSRQVGMMDKGHESLDLAR